MGHIRRVEVEVELCRAELLYVRQAFFVCRDGLMNGLWTGVQPVHIAHTSRMVQDYTGMAIQPHKVGHSAALGL